MSQQCALAKKQEVKLLVLNKGPVLLQRNLESQGIVEGTVVTFAIREKKDAEEIQKDRRRIWGCLSGDRSYHDLVRKLTADQVEEVAGSVSSAEECLRKLLLVADAMQRWKLLEVASRRGILDTSEGILGVRELLKSNIDATSECNKGALQVALQWARPQVAKTLLEASCTVKQTDASGDTPLLTAVMAMSQTLHTQRSMCSLGDLTNDAMLDVVELMLSRMSDAWKNHSNRGGETALIRACSENMPRSVKLLVDSGCQVNATDSNGRAALHHAAVKPACISACTLLIDAKANVHLSDYSTRTSLMVAVENANAECVKLLISAKASVRDACAAETVFMAAVTRCIDSGLGERQRKVLKCLIEADFEFFLSCQEELQERAAEEADSDMYEFLCSRKRPRRDKS